MANKKNSTPSGKVVYNSSIVRGIVVLAVGEVPGVVVDDSAKGAKDNIKIEFSGNKNVSVDVTVSVRYGLNIPDVAYNIQQSIKHSVEAMSDYRIDNVDVHVVDIVFDEEHAD